MSIKNNTTSLQGLLSIVNSLPEAGGGSNIGVTTGTFTVIDNGMYEPGTNEYVLTSEDLQSSGRIMIAVISGSQVKLLFVRENTNSVFDIYRGNTTGSVFTGNCQISGNNSITVNGTITSSNMNQMQFVAI